MSIFAAEELKKLKSRVSTLEAMSSSMNAHTSRLSAPIDGIDGYNEVGSKAAYVNSLDSDNTGLQRNVQQMVRAELQSEPTRGTSQHIIQRQSICTHSMLKYYNNWSSFLRVCVFSLPCFFGQSWKRTSRA